MRKTGRPLCDPPPIPPFSLEPPAPASTLERTRLGDEHRLFGDQDVADENGQIRGGPGNAPPQSRCVREGHRPAPGGGDDHSADSGNDHRLFFRRPTRRLPVHLHLPGDQRGPERRCHPALRHRDRARISGHQCLRKSDHDSRRARWRHRPLPPVQLANTHVQHGRRRRDHLQRPDLPIRQCRKHQRAARGRAVGSGRRSDVRQLPLSGQSFGERWRCSPSRERIPDLQRVHLSQQPNRDARRGRWGHLQRWKQYQFRIV